MIIHQISLHFFALVRRNIYRFCSFRRLCIRHKAFARSSHRFSANNTRLACRTVRGWYQSISFGNFKETDQLTSQKRNPHLKNISLTC